MSVEAVMAAFTALQALSGAKSAFDPDSSGGGGGVSSKTSAGNNQIEFNPVGIETLQGITPFEYGQMQQEFDKEQAQNMQYGGPLYAAEGNSVDFKTQIAQDIFGQGIKDIMPGGILGLLLASNFLDNKDDEEEESIVPGLKDGAAIPVVFDTNLYDPEIIVSEDINALSPDSETNKRYQKDFENKLKNDILLGQLSELFSEGFNPLMAVLDSKNKSDAARKRTIKGQGNIVPQSGGRIARQQRQKTASKGVTPFEYKAMQGGGALNRKMFMQNYMPNGGDIRGPGGPKDDLIPVMASNGEYMLSKAAVDQAGGGNHSKGIANLEQFNNRGNRRYG